MFKFFLLVSPHDYGNTNLSTSPEASNHQTNLSISVVGPPTTQKNNKKMKFKQKKLLIDKGKINYYSAFFFKKKKN